MPLTLLIVHRSSDKPLLDYADGPAYEFVGFARFQLPPEQISVQCQDAAGTARTELTPVTAR